MNAADNGITWAMVFGLSLAGGLGAIGLAVVLGFREGIRIARLQVRMFNMLISKDVMPPSDDVILVNLSKNCFHSRSGAMPPDRIIVERNGVHIDMQGSSFRMGVPIEELVSHQTEKNTIAYIGKDGVH